MNPDKVKSIIRLGQTDDVIFLDCNDHSFDISPHIKNMLDFKSGYILLGVKDCGTVVGIKDKEDVLLKSISPLTEFTPIKIHVVSLIRYFKIIVLEYFE
ncbi:MAG: hypothetical protein COA79_25365 [Planctomycetota bacterium]|nr:MAG: hypothetical protein COA79_25365 [Planctomycetota bacterium]